MDIFVKREKRWNNHREWMLNCGLEMFTWLGLIIIGNIFDNANRIPVLNNLPCLFKQLTGRPCFTCGMTSGWLELWHGHFAAAWQSNPLVYLLALICGIRLYQRFSESRFGWYYDFKRPVIFYCFAIFLSSIYGIARICGV
jgi:hypothetical protein